MNHGWEKFRFGDLCEIVRGGSPRPIQSYLTDSVEGLNWIKIGDVAPGSKYITSTKEKIKPEGLSKTRQVFKGDFILSNSMSFGRPYILKIDGCIHDGWLAIKNVDAHFNPDFLFYFLSSPSTYSKFERLVKGGVVSNLNSDIVKGLVIPVPPPILQQKIASELDKLNELIELKRNQLKDLDTLAQSLFYETFGDPIENPKRWEIKSLSSVAPQQQYEGEIVDNNGLYWLLNLDIIEKNTGRIINYLYVKADEIGNSVYKIGPGQVLFSKLRPNLNKVVIANHSGFCTSELLPLNPKNGILNSIFLSYLLRLPTCVSIFSGKVAGAKMPRVDLKVFRNFPLILPPISLQNEFAEIIEAIEEQKRLIESSISDLETLLASRMDYWFND